MPSAVTTPDGTDFRGVIRQAARNDTWGSRDPRGDFPHAYREHLEEAFSELYKRVHHDHPDAELRCVGSDMGGPIYELVLND